MRKKIILIIALLLAVPCTSFAIPVTSGDIIRVDFDLSAQNPAPPYDGIYTLLAFGSSDYLNLNEGLSIAIFDGNGAGLTDGTGYYILYNIIGSFDLTGASAAGRYYSGSTVTDSTPSVAGSISTLSTMPDLNNSLSLGQYTTYVNNISDSISSLGIDNNLVRSTVPEPSGLLLMGVGLFALGLVKKC